MYLREVIQMRFVVSRRLVDGTEHVILEEVDLDDLMTEFRDFDVYLEKLETGQEIVIERVE